MFGCEKQASLEIAEDRKFSYEERNGQNVRVYSRTFIKVYNEKLKGQVEARFLASIKLLGAFWCTAWVDAGQPDLNNLTPLPAMPEANNAKDVDKDHDCNAHFH